MGDGSLPDGAGDGGVDVGGGNCYGCAEGERCAGVRSIRRVQKSVKRYSSTYLASTGYEVAVMVSVAVEVTMGVDAV